MGFVLKHLLLRVVVLVVSHLGVNAAHHDSHQHLLHLFDGHLMCLALQHLLFRVGILLVSS